MSVIASRIKFTEARDMALLRECVATQAFRQTKGLGWRMVCQNLRKSGEFPEQLTTRACRDRVNCLLEKYKSKKLEEQDDLTGLDQVDEEIQAKYGLIEAVIESKKFAETSDGQVSSVPAVPVAVNSSLPVISGTYSGNDRRSMQILPITPKQECDVTYVYQDSDTHGEEVSPVPYQEPNVQVNTLYTPTPHTRHENNSRNRNNNSSKRRRNDIDDYDDDEARNSDDVMRAACLKFLKSTTLVEDEHDFFGKVMASKLRTMTLEQRIYAERLMSDVLCRAQLGLLTIDSFVKTPKGSDGSSEVVSSVRVNIGD